MKRVLRFLRDFCWDLTAACGALMTGLGLWWIYPPAALIAGGIALTAFALWGAKRWVS